MIVKNYLKSPLKYTSLALIGHSLLKWLPDKPYLKLLFWAYTDKKLDLKNPKTFNEKLQWLKLYDRKPEYTQMVDKYEAKRYVAERIGEEYIVPTFGVWDKFEDIDFDSLPDQFVLKTTHDCGGLVICRDKSKLDKEMAKNKIDRSLRRNYYYHSREWPYKNVKPRIIAEKYLENTRKTDSNLDVYKIFCFDGEPTMIQVIQNDKTKDESIDYFDVDWNVLNLRQNFPNSEVPLRRPNQLTKMLDLAGTLSQGHPFLRVDLYEVENQIYFSELTFYSDAGVANFDPPEWDRILGEKLSLQVQSKQKIH